jgi:tetratricopeptide (TPR) repeat protein
MKLGIFAMTVLLARAGAAASPASEAVFDQGMQALSTSNCDTALGLFEKALSDDPENVRYASEYRMAALRCAKAAHPKEGQPQDFDRPLKFFEKLAEKNPGSSNVFLNYGFAYVDKIPAAGSITQVILANSALTYFTKSLTAKATWVGFYTRGNSYLFWPKIFGRAKLGVADLEEALRMQKSGPKKPYHARVYVALGDGYWKTDNIEKARSVWAEGLKQFPDSAPLKDRLARQGDELKTYIDDALDPAKRVDTNLKDLWMNP